MSRYVDADGHIMEKTTDFIGYLEEPLEERRYSHRAAITAYAR